MVTFPPAKINIGLRITEKRADGYHNIETVFYPVGLCDALEFTISKSEGGNDSLVMTGTEEQFPASENLVMKALNKLRENRAIPPLDIHLHKAIPSGAGLGGGSSDASSFITQLNSYFKLGIPASELADTASQLGSDCAFFITGRPAYATGRGEILRPVERIEGEWYLVIVKPDISINTAMAYKGCIPSGHGEDLAALYSAGPHSWKGRLINDFEKTLFPLHPVLGEIKESLYSSGAVYASMSGSGSAIYGLFSTLPELPPAIRKMVIWQGKL